MPATMQGPAMKLLFFCPLGHRLAVPQARAGKRGRCPICAQLLIIPRIGISADTFYPPPPPPPAGSTPELVPFEFAELFPSDETTTVLDADFAAAQMQLAQQELAQQEISRQVDIDDSTLMALDTMIAEHKLTAPAAATIMGGKNALIVPFANDHKSAAADPDFNRAKVTLPPRGNQPPDAHLASSPGRRSTYRVSRQPSAMDTGARRRMFLYVSEPREALRWLAAMLLVLAILGMSPLVKADSLVNLPVWGQITILLGTVQVAFALWLLVVPDWLSAWICMLVQVAAATIHAIGLVLLLTSGQPPFEVGGSRAYAAIWCGSQTLLLFMAAYGCLRISGWWQSLETNRLLPAKRAQVGIAD